MAIIVTPFSGDPDIFVVTSAFDTQQVGASQSFWQWKSIYYGGDTLQIQYDDTKFALGELEISIYGASSITSSFVVVATTSPRSGNISTIQLVDGLPLGGRVRTSGGYNYYTYQPSDPHVGIAFNVAKRYGDPDVFIKMFPDVPSYTDFIWQGSHSGSDYVVVNGADPRACGVAPTLDPCVFLIAVRGYTATSYTITVTSQMVTGQLQSGIPVFGFVQQYKYVYYFIDVSEDQPNLQISVTSISTGGDPDLYVSKTFLQPNRTAYDWRQSSWGSEELTIQPALRSKYYIGVYGWSNDSFSITATYNNSVTLAPGQPYSDSVSTYGAIRFYTFHVDVGSSTPPASGLTVSLSAAVNGYVDLYIALGGQAGPGQANGWTSLATSVSGGKYLYISPTDNAACWTGDSCTYSLAVRARSYGKFSYSLTYFYGDDVITLEPAVPFSAQVVQGSYVMFRAMVSLASQDISISSTGLIGDVALYVAQNITDPNSTNFTWSATINSQIGLHVAISAQDQIAPGWLYIAVLGVTNAQFNLLLTTDNVMLISGNPQDAVCGYSGASKYYFMNFMNNADGSTDQADIIFDIVGRTSTDTFQLYIVTDSSAPGVTKPNMTTSTWTPALTSGAQFRIQPNDQFYCRVNCTFYVGIACTSTIAWWKTYNHHRLDRRRARCRRSRLCAGIRRCPAEVVQVLRGLPPDGDQLLVHPRTVRWGGRSVHIHYLSSTGQNQS